jgi:hypothetical protein
MQKGSPVNSDVLNLNDELFNEIIKVDTVGESAVIIKGKNFGLNPRVSLQSKTLFGNKIYALMDETTGDPFCISNYLIPAYDMASGLCVKKSNDEITTPLVQCGNFRDPASENPNDDCGNKEKCGWQ